jgi:serine/threonine protein kinase
MPAELPKLNIPKNFKGYQLVRCLGTGFMAETYLGSLEERGKIKEVVVKFVRPELARRLPSANIPQNRDVDMRFLRYGGVADGRRGQWACHYVTDFLNVKPLTLEVLAEATFEERLLFFQEIADALVWLHGYGDGAIHGNLRPTNILVRKQRVSRTETKIEPIITDLGFHYIYDGAIHDDPEWAPRLYPYMAPELIEGFVAAGAGGEFALTAAMDIYALGATICHAFTGAVPFTLNGECTREEILAAKRDERYLIVVKNDPTSRLDIRAFNGFVRKCLAFEPGERHADMKVFAEELRRCLEPEEAAKV